MSQQSVDLTSTFNFIFINEILGRHAAGNDGFNPGLRVCDDSLNEFI